MFSHLLIPSIPSCRKDSFSTRLKSFKSHQTHLTLTNEKINHKRGTSYITTLFPLSYGLLWLVCVAITTTITLNTPTTTTIIIKTTKLTQSMFSILGCVFAGLCSYNNKNNNINNNNNTNSIYLKYRCSKINNNNVISNSDTNDIYLQFPGLCLC